jgi:hypothetical protein
MHCVILGFSSSLIVLFILDALLLSNLPHVNRTLYSFSVFPCILSPALPLIAAHTTNYSVADVMHKLELSPDAHVFLRANEGYADRTTK